MHWKLTKLISFNESVSCKIYHLVNMQHLYYADVLLEKGEISAEEIRDIYEKAPRFPQVVFLDFRKMYFHHWEIIIACLLSHGSVRFVSLFFKLHILKVGVPSPGAPEVLRQSLLKLTLLRNQCLKFLENIPNIH